MIPHALTLHRLRIFMTVVEQGSFNRAAQALLLSQAAVSQQIKALEDGLAVVLFDRGPQGVVPTAAGESLYQRARDILAAVTAAENDLARFAPRMDKRLRVAATSGISTHILPPWLSRFQTAFPDVSLSLQTGQTAEVVSRVLQETSDFALIANGLNDFSDGRLGRRTLQEIRYRLVVRPDHPWVEKGEVTLRELASAPFLDRQPDSRTRRWLRGRLAEAGIELWPSAELDSPDMVKAGVLSGLGISILPEYVVEKDIARGDLVSVEIKDVNLARPLDLLWHNRRPQGQIHLDFVAMLEALSTPDREGI